MEKRKLGWIPQPPDERDHQKKFSVTYLPPLVDLRDHCPPVYDQGQLGSCTGNASAGAFQFDEIKQGKASDIPSRLFIYWNERDMEGTVNDDAGAIIRDAVKVLAKYGVCSETTWPYDVDKFAEKPSEDCYTEALNNQVLEYAAVDQSLDQIKSCLVCGFPIIFGFTVFESFMSEQVASTGIVPMPRVNEVTDGGHAVLAVGYDDSKHAVIVRNSWGESWGDKGYFYLPYEYITNPSLASDFWTIRRIE